MIHESNGLHLKDDAADSGDETASMKVSGRVRDIVTRNLATPDEDCSAAAADTPTVEQLTEENRILQVRLVFILLCLVISK